MARSYRHISEYEEEILRLKAEGKTRRETGEILGFSFDQIHNFLTRYNEKQRYFPRKQKNKKVRKFSNHRTFSGLSDWT
ncbi:MAG: helix-turn-helix domain-containing protein [Clostridia bacterium]|nr:helix-turn-helix domain-containing protein [Clostridia bacterium]